MNIVDAIRRHFSSACQTIDELGYYVIGQSPTYTQCTFFNDRALKHLSIDAIAELLSYQRRLGSSTCVVLEGEFPILGSRIILAYFDSAIKATGVVGEFKFVKSRHRQVGEVVRVTPELYGRLLNRKQNDEPRVLSPLAIRMLLTYSYASDPEASLGIISRTVPAHEARKFFEEEGLVTRDGDALAVTARGKAYIEALCRVPFPPKEGA